MRTERPDIGAITTSIKRIEAGPDQMFMELPKSYELWQMNPLARIATWNKKNIYWILPRKETP